MIAQILFVVWRESIEALLVIGILQAWSRQGGGMGAWLWGGVVAGLAGAVALAAGLNALGDALPPEGQDLFNMALLLVASGLILQMVLWMRAHGRTLKRDLQQGLGARSARGQAWGVFALAAIAVMREGAETVVFLQGILSATGWTAATLGAMAWALVLALVSYGLLQAGGHFLSWRLFFRVTEVMLLALGAALFTSGTGYLVSLGVLPYTAPLWDLSWALDDARPLGALAASLTGWRSAPDVVTLAAWVLWWGGVALALRPRLRVAGA